MSLSRGVTFVTIVIVVVVGIALTFVSSWVSAVGASHVTCDDLLRRRAALFVEKKASELVAVAAVGGGEEGCEEG